MKKLLFALPLMAILFFSSCTVEDEVDPNIASQIVGTYSMTDYKYHTSTEDISLKGTAVSQNTITISRVDDTHVNVVTNYPDSPKSNDSDSNVLVETSGEDFKLSKNYTNSTVKGTLSTSLRTIAYDVDYTNGDYVYLKGEK